MGASSSFYRLAMWLLLLFFMQVSEERREKGFEWVNGSFVSRWKGKKRAQSYQRRGVGATIRSERRSGCLFLFSSPGYVAAAPVCASAVGSVKQRESDECRVIPFCLSVCRIAKRSS